MPGSGGYYDTDSDPDGYSGSGGGSCGGESYYFSGDDSCCAYSDDSVLADEADDMLLQGSSDSDFSAIDEDELEELRGQGAGSCS